MVALLLALGLAGYGGLFFALSPSGPGAEAVCSAAALIRSEHRSGDHILLLPAYATRARELLGDLQPVAPKDPLREDFEPHPRVWVLGMFGAAESVRPVLETVGLRPAGGTTVDGVAVARFDNPAPARVRADLSRQLESATVELRLPGGRSLACDRRRSRSGQGGRTVRWECPRDSEWQYVAAEWHRMGDHLRRCLWAHPPNQGELWIHFPRVPLDGQLVGRGGHTLHSSRHARAPVQLAVAVDDWSETHAFELEDTWRSFRHDLRLLGRGTDTATVSFGVWSSDPGVNHFCFTADVREASATGGRP